MKFSELIPEYVIKTDKERIRENTRDDFRLGPEWRFIGGFYRDIDDEPLWHTVWGRVAPTYIEQYAGRMTEDTVESLDFIRRHKGEAEEAVHVFAHDRHMIAQVDMGVVTDIPEELHVIIR
jgi:hypothetical protein